jgi:hypothetical protein
MELSNAIASSSRQASNAPVTKPTYDALNAKLLAELEKLKPSTKLASHTGFNANLSVIPTVISAHQLIDLSNISESDNDGSMLNSTAIENPFSASAPKPTSSTGTLETYESSPTKLEHSVLHPPIQYGFQQPAIEQRPDSQDTSLEEHKSDNHLEIQLAVQTTVNPEFKQLVLQFAHNEEGFYNQSRHLQLELHRTERRLLDIRRERAYYREQYRRYQSSQEDRKRRRVEIVELSQSTHNESEHQDLLAEDSRLAKELEDTHRKLVTSSNASDKLRQTEIETLQRLKEIAKQAEEYQQHIATATNAYIQETLERQQSLIEEALQKQFADQYDTEFKIIESQHQEEIQAVRDDLDKYFREQLLQIVNQERAKFNAQLQLTENDRAQLQQLYGQQHEQLIEQLRSLDKFNQQLLSQHKSSNLIIQQQYLTNQEQNNLLKRREAELAAYSTSSARQAAPPQHQHTGDVEFLSAIDIDPSVLEISSDNNVQSPQSKSFFTISPPKVAGFIRNIFTTSKRKERRNSNPLLFGSDRVEFDQSSQQWRPSPPNKNTPIITTTNNQATGPPPTSSTNQQQPQAPPQQPPVIPVPTGSSPGSQQNQQQGQVPNTPPPPLKIQVQDQPVLHQLPK